MIEKIGEFTGREQKVLTYKSWCPESEEIKACIVAIHGLGGDTSVFKSLAEYLTSHNYVIYAFDLRGHGLNRGEYPGHIESMDHLEKDLLFFIDLIKKEVPEKKVFLLGHCLGGLVCLIYAIHHPQLDGIIATSPLLALQIKIPGIKKLLKKLSKDPEKKIPFEIDQKLLTSDLKILKKYLSDKNRLKEISIKTYSEIDKAMKWALSNAENLYCPVLILQAGNEKLSDKKVVKQFFERIKTENKNYKEYPLLLHEIISEKTKTQVFQDIFLWLEKHLKK
ncbi:MAG: alpha/beta fold hydrolase [Promethearchaeota archaeon]